MEHGTDLLRDFFVVERQHIPKGDFRFKDTCWSSKLRAFYARPFNYRYLTDYTTTIYPITYFPSATYVRENPYGATRTEFHEFVHKWDRLKDGILFNVKYLYPQIFAVPFILGAVAAGGPYSWATFAVFLLLLHVGLYVLHVATGEPGERPKQWGYRSFYTLTAAGLVPTVVASILFGKWFALLWLGAGLFASPWPLKARWRRDYELRGYTMSFYAEWLRHGTVRPEIVERRIKNFTGPDYFFMERDGKLIRNELLFQISRFDKGSFEDFFLWGFKKPVNPKHKGNYMTKRIEMAKPYKIVKEFMQHKDLTKKPKLVA